VAKEYYLYVKGKAVPVSEEEKQKLEEEERKINERKDRLHQNYLKRKANGKQQEYEERYKARLEQKKQEKLRVLKRVGILVKGSDDNL
jgi:hypothetical protein